jgi:hypothetical protein
MKPGPRKSGESHRRETRGGGPDFNVINRCADRVYPPYTVAHRPPTLASRQDAAHRLL